MARRLQVGLGIVAVLVFMAASGAMNAHFWLSQGKSELEGQILAAVSIAGDLFKAMLPFFIAAAFAAGRWIKGFVGIGLMTLVLVFSLMSALGFAAGNRGAVSGGREAVNARLEAVTSELRDVDIQISKLGDIKDIRIVESALEVKKQDVRWTWSKNCADATAPKSREFCTEYLQMAGELAAATTVARLRERQATLRREALKLREHGAGQAADPQASLLAKLVPLADASLMQTVVMVLIAVMVELVAAFGLWLATAGLREPVARSGDGRGAAEVVPLGPGQDVPSRTVAPPVATVAELERPREIERLPAPKEQRRTERPARPRRDRTATDVTAETGAEAVDRVSEGTVGQGAAPPSSTSGRQPERFRLEEAHALLAAPAG